MTLLDWIPIICLHADPAGAPGAQGAGGTHSYLRELAIALPQQGRRCTIITRRASAEAPPRQTLSTAAEIVRVQIGKIGPMDKLLLNQHNDESLMRIREVLDIHRAELRIIHSVYWNSGRVAMELSAVYGIPFVHTVISNGIRRQIESAANTADDRIAVERRVFHAAAAILSVSAAEREDLITLYGVDPSRIVVVGRPVDVAFRFPAHDELGQPRAPLPLAESDS